MVQLGVGCPDDPVPRLPDLEAEVHVIEGDFQVDLVKSPDRAEDILPHDHAGGGDARYVTDELELSKIAGGTSRKGLVGVAGHAAHADHHARVLDRIVAV